MKRNLFGTTILSLSLGIIFTLGGTTVIAQENIIDSFWLDTHSEKAATGNENLGKGVRFIVQINGTASLWNAGEWSNLCPQANKPVEQPMYSSSGVTNGKVGVDPAYFFAWPKNASLCKNINNKPPLPSSLLEFSTDGGSNWSNLKTVQDRYKTNHSYFYYVTGQGEKLQLRFNDSHDDNYGKFHINVIFK